VRTETWRLGTNTELDQLFNTLREVQYNDCSHALWKNYSAEAFVECEAVSITFVDKEPFFCGGILKRDCWPNNTYRILNRLWKPAPRLKILKRISPGLGSMVHDQLAWLQNNTDYELAFISRETDTWQEFTIDNFRTHFNIDFEMDSYKYLTCSNECDDSCWQKIIYRGNTELLKDWKRK
jgi:hypothetical protein